MAKGANKKTAWKGIQKKANDVDRPASIASQDSRKTAESKDDSKVLYAMDKLDDPDCWHTV